MNDVDSMAREIAQKLLQLVEREADRRQNMEHNCYNDLQYLAGTIRARYNEALELYQDAKANGLSTNMVEAEGYLRAYTQMKAFVDGLHSGVSESAVPESLYQAA